MNTYHVSYGLDVSVEILRENGIASVSVIAPVYKNKRWEMPHCYSDTFTDAQILRDSDFLRVLSRRYGPSERHGA